MEYIQIPAPDFSFSEFVRKQAMNTIKTYLQEGAISMLAQGYEENKQVVYNAIKDVVYEYSNIEDRLDYLSELLIHLASLKSIEKFTYKGYSNVGNIPAIKVKDEDYYDEVTALQFFIYNLITSFGYKLDKNTFSTDEINDLNSKINDILYKLNELKAGQEIIYNEFEEVKEQIKADFESLKSDSPLGKKRFFKIALGTVGSYTGNKIADEIFAQLRPSIVALLTTLAPHLLESFKKMIGEG